MKVKEIYEVMKHAVEAGYGDLDVYVTHGASGCNYELDMYKENVKYKDDWDDQGPLCDMPDGFIYYGGSID